MMMSDNTSDNKQQTMKPKQVTKQNFLHPIVYADK